MKMSCHSNTFYLSQPRRRIPVRAQILSSRARHASAKGESSEPPQPPANVAMANRNHPWLGKQGVEPRESWDTSHNQAEMGWGGGGTDNL